MPLTGEAKAAWMKKYNADRKAAAAAAAEGRPVEPDWLKLNISEAKAWDGNEANTHYLSEASSMMSLVELFHGVKKQIEDVEDEEDGRKKKKKAKNVIVKPSTSKIFGQKITFKQWLALRDRCRKDGMFLGKTTLGRNLLTPRVHQPIFDQFVQKNFDGVYYEGYTIEDVHTAIMRHRKSKRNPEGREKELLLLDPRANLKSTIDGIDAVQWILNCPDIRIFLMTGEDSLAESFLKEIKDYFTLAKGAEPTDFHLLFPEYILRGRAAASGTPLWCPVRKHGQKEATLWVNSVTSNLSGWHCDIKKGDDVVTDKNSNNEDIRKKLKEKFDGTNELLDAWGFNENVGTRYWTDDWYGERLKVREKAPLRYFCRAAWTVKPEFASLKLKELKVDMVDLLFPERMTGGEMTEDSIPLAWEDLQAKLNLNERSFRNQQLNDPTDAEEDDPFKIIFKPDTLTKHSYHKSIAELQLGNIFVAWDWAYSDSARSDLSVGVAAKIYQNDVGDWGIIVLDVIYDHWSPSKLAHQMVFFNKKWNPKRTLIEETSAAEIFKEVLKQVAWKLQTPLDFFWFKPDQSLGAKRNRIKNLELLLNKDLLWFVTGGTWLDETFKQFGTYKGDNSTKKRKDDIPDAISFLTLCSPRLRMKRP